MNFLERFDKKNIKVLSLKEGLAERQEPDQDKLEIMQRLSKMYQKLKADDPNVN